MNGNVRGDLEILEERTMLELPRGRDGREVLRLRFVCAKTSEGKEVAWHDIREFFQGDDGQWLPGKKGIVLRGKELRPVADALAKACTGSPSAPRPLAPPTPPTTPAPSPAVQRRAPEDEPRAPFGRQKGDPLAVLEMKDLRWLEGALERSIQDPEKTRWRAKNEKDLASVRGEISSRGGF